LSLGPVHSQGWDEAAPLSADVIARYAARAAEGEEGASHLLPDAEGDTAPAGGQRLETKGGWHLFPTPRPWQEEALASLAAIRADGYSKALVAVAPACQTCCTPNLVRYWLTPS
jgi:hypothetical protein